jgi:hypothetical protein
VTTDPPHDPLMDLKNLFTLSKSLMVIGVYGKLFGRE